MVIPGYPERLIDLLVLLRTFDVLRLSPAARPRGVAALATGSASRVLITPCRTQCLAPGLQLLGGNQHVRGAFPQVDPHPVARAQ